MALDTITTGSFAGDGQVTVACPVPTASTGKLTIRVARSSQESPQPSGTKR